VPQAVWTGSLSFGLVAIPVKLYGATAPRDVRFHQYEGGTGRRVRYRRVAAGPPPEPEREQEPEPEPLEDRPAPQRARPPGPEPTAEPEVAWEDIVKGFEIEPGRVVTVTPEELTRVAPERTRVLEVEEFVDLPQIDPVHFEKSYYVVPHAGMGAERPYWLLFRAMRSSGKVAIGRFVMRTREYLAAVRPGPDVLTLETLFFADEVRDPREVWSPIREEPNERELRVARHLIEALAATWDPARHRDTQRERVLELLRSKADEAFVLPPPEEEATAPRATDLMAALKASVEAARQASAAAPGRKPRRTG
jgi:DNA end-binding protein Ku